MLLSGIVAAIVTSPIFDRVLTHHLGLAVRIICPIIAAAWLSLIWAGKKVLLPFSLSSLILALLITVRPHNVVALFAIFIVIGVCSITLLPIAIELGVELTGNPDGSSAVLWFLCALCFFTELPHQRLISFVRSANMLCIIFVLGQSRLFRLPHGVLALHLLIYIYFFPFFILRSARCSPRLSRSEPTAEHARHIHIQWRLGVHCRHANFLPRRKTGTTRTGRTNVRGTRGKGYYGINSDSGTFSFTGVIKGKISFFFFAFYGRLSELRTTCVIYLSF